MDREGEGLLDGWDIQMGTIEMIQRKGGDVDDKLNVPLEDAELLAEVELTTNLIIAASESEATLSQEQVDQLLGLGESTRPKSVPSQQRRLD
jgi:hypothetical protein